MAVSKEDFIVSFLKAYGRSSSTFILDTENPEISIATRRDIESIRVTISLLKKNCFSKKCVVQKMKMQEN